MEVHIKRLEPLRVASRRHEGPYEGLAGTAESLVAWLRARGSAGGAVTAVFADAASLEAGVAVATGGDHCHDAGRPVTAEVWVPAGAAAAGPTHDEEGVQPQEHPAEAGSRSASDAAWGAKFAEDAVDTSDAKGPQSAGFADVSIKMVPAALAACVTHTGDPLRVPHLALSLRGFLREQGKRIGKETRVVHVMPDWTDPSNWVAEVQVVLDE